MPNQRPSYITDLYQQNLNRAPTAADLSFWTMQDNPAVGIQNSREAQINGIYKDILGRAPDAGGLTHYANLYPTMGHMGVRQDIMRQPEAQNRMLDDWDVFQQQARSATAGVNAMPYTYSDYTNPSMAPANAMQAVYPQPTQGGSTLAQLLGMVGSMFTPDAATGPKQEPTTPAKTPVLDVLKPKVDPRLTVRDDNFWRRK